MPAYMDCAGMPSVKPQTDSGPRPRAHDAPHLAALDALRGLAITFVIIGHYLPGRVVGGTFGTIFQPWAVGGIILFFLLSGFLIGRNLSLGTSPIGYGLRRIFRIFPAYWVSLAVLIVLHRLLLQDTDFGSTDTLYNALLLQDVGNAPLFNAAFWTLLIEAKFYVVAPFLVLGGKRIIQLAPYLAIAANGLIQARRGEASNLLTYLTFCFVGMNFELWHRKELGDWALAVLVICAAVAVGVFSPYLKIGLFIFGLVNAALFGVALKHAPRLQLPTLGFVGAISYSWYLYHGGIGYPLMAGLEASRWLMSPLLSTIIAVAVTLLAAWLSYRLIEQPGISLGRWLEKRVLRLGAMPKQS
jgi:peptidoglycan/LPS O-acetylase OafA/YrhL